VRYTRYNYKPPKKNNNFIIIITLTLIAAIALGTIFSKLLPNSATSSTIEDKPTKISIDKGSADSPKEVSQSNTKDYVAIQCGVFSTNERALILKNSLMKFGTPFILQEGKLNKVFFGIYPKEGIDNIVKGLKLNKIDYATINFQLIGNDSTSAQTNEMISADIKILNKLSEKDTKSIQTVELKKWMTSLKGEEEKSKNFVAMTEMKSYLTAMPAELKREKAEEGYIYIYKFINKLLKT